MSEWYATLPGLWRESWAELQATAKDRNATARHTVLATIGKFGGPETRITVLRAADPIAASVAVHTDKTSTKVNELRDNPKAALHLWQPKKDLQIRLRGQITIETGDAVRNLWAKIPAGPRSSYGVHPAPGTPIPAADAYTRIANPDHFTVLTLTIEEADIVHLSADFHRRALFCRSDGWAGQWLAP